MNFTKIVNFGGMSKYDDVSKILMTSQHWFLFQNVRKGLGIICAKFYCPRSLSSKVIQGGSPPSDTEPLKPLVLIGLRVIVVKSLAEYQI